MVKLEQHTTAQINALPTTAGRLVYDSDLNTVKYINGTSAIEVGSGGGALTAPVGISTSAPDKALEINSTTGDCLRLTYNDADGSAVNYTDFAVSSSGDLTITPSGGDTTLNGPLTVIKNGLGLIHESGTGAKFITSCSGNTDVYAGSDSNHPFHLLSNNFIRMTLKTDGTVGIGTTVISSKQLEVNSVTGDCLRLKYNNTANIVDFEVTSTGRLVIDPSGSSNDILFEFSGSNLLFSKSGTIDSIVQNASSGKLILNPGVYSVGVGTTNPDKKLEINSTTGDCLRLTYNDDSGSAANYADFAVSSGGDLTIASSGGNITISGTIDIEDNTLLLNSVPSGSGRDSGIIIERYQIANDAGTGDVVTDTAKETYALDAATSTTITLPTGGNATDDYYNNWWIKMTSGAGINEVRQVTDYVGSTKVATLSTAFTATPSAADNVSLYNKPYSTMIWQEANDTFVSAYISTDVTGALTIIDKADFECNNLAGTLITAAQPNITSLGTLTSLTLSGAISGVTTLTATSLAGTLTTAAQANVTSLGTLTSLTLSGAISGVTTLTATSLAGTLTTAAQTNITSLGTLTSMSVTGSANFGNLPSGSRIRFVESGGVMYFQTGSDANTGSAADFFIGNYFQTITISARKNMFKADGKVGFGTTAPDKQLEINSATGDCLRLTYNDSNGSAANYTDLAVNSDGRLILTSSKGKVGIHSDNRGTYDVEKEPTLQIMQYEDYNGTGDVALGEFTALRIGTNSDNKNNNEVTSYTIDYDYNQDRFTAGKLIFKSMNNTAGGAPTDLSFQTSKSANWTVNSIMTLWDTNVGIGTTAPADTLHVLNAEYNQLRLESSSATSAANIKFVTTTKTYEMGCRGPSSGNANSFYWYDGTYRLIIDSGGNVGINTTAPDRQLEINSSNGNCLRLTYNDSNGSAASYCDLILDSGGSLTFVLTGDRVSFNNSTTNLRIGELNSITPSEGQFIGTTFSGTVRKLALGIDDNSTMQSYMLFQETNNTNDTAYMAFYTTNVLATPAVERMRIDWNGDVGIGTTSPGTTLHVEDSVSADGHQMLRLTNRDETNGTGATISFYKTAAGTTETCRINNHKFASGDYALAFAVYDSSLKEHMVLRSGRVGIGTNAPSELLTIYQGNILLDDSNTYANEKYISAKWESTGNTHSIGMHFDYYTGTGTTSTTHSRIRFISNAEDNEAIYGTGRQDMMTILSNGNVGIGEISPTMRLSLGATASDKILALYDTASFYGFGANSSNLRYQSGGGHQFYTSSTDVALGTLAMTIDTSENVTIVNDLTVTNIVYSQATGAQGSPSYSFIGDTDTGMYRGGANILGFSTAGTRKVTIDAGGFVGIGENTPSALLHLKQTNNTGTGGIYLESSLSSSVWKIFMDAGGELQFYFNTNQRGYLSYTVNVDNIDFTGQHRSSTSNTNINTTPADYIGLIVSSLGTYKNINNAVLDINNAIPEVDLSTIDNDKKVFGVISDREEDGGDSRTYTQGAFYSVIDKDTGDERLIINSLGEGMVWVCDKGGNLENGDFITSSTAAGYGQLQSDDFFRNYTVGKITQDCDFTTLTITRWVDLAGAIITEATYDANTALGYRCYFVGCVYYCG